MKIGFIFTVIAFIGTAVQVSSATPIFRPSSCTAAANENPLCSAMHQPYPTGPSRIPTKRAMPIEVEPQPTSNPNLDRRQSEDLGNVRTNPAAPTPAF